MQRSSVRIDLMLAAAIYIIGIIGVLKIGPARPKNRSSRQIGGESPEVVDLRAYLTTVLDREWPDMQQRNESRVASASFQAFWQTVETVNTDPADNQVRGQMLNLLATAHQSRETRLFQMTQSVPGLIWTLLIVFAATLIGCMLVFAAEASISKAVLVGVFTSSLTLALLTVRMLDFPFESALQLSSHDFNETLAKVDRLIAVARPND
jgi:hypothetical protein